MATFLRMGQPWAAASYRDGGEPMSPAAPQPSPPLPAAFFPVYRKGRQHGATWLWGSRLPQGVSGSSTWRALSQLQPGSDVLRLPEEQPSTTKLSSFPRFLQAAKPLLLHRGVPQACCVRRGEGP